MTTADNGAARGDRARGATVRDTTAGRLLRAIATAQAGHRTPSLAAAVVRDCAVVWSGARGRVDGRPPTPRTQYRIGSITKPFVAVVVLRLRDEGRLRLTDPLDTHLPGTPVGDVTIAQLLAHAGGVTAEPPGPWWERTPGEDYRGLAARFDAGDAGPTGRGSIAKHRPGRRHHYSNLGFGLLGEVVARLRGHSWFDAVAKEVIAPLGLADTTPAPRAPYAPGYAVHPWADVLLPEPHHDAGALAPAGQLWSTTTDMARWAAFLAGDTGDVLRPDTYAEMCEPAIVPDGAAWTDAHGLGVQLARENGRRLVGHGGSMPGFVGTVWASPAERIGAVYLCNSTAGAGNVSIELIETVAACEPALPPEWAPSEVPADLLELTGPWYWGPRPSLLRVLGDGKLDLSPLRGSGRASRFVPAGDDTWTGLDGYYAGETLRVVRDDAGHPNHLDLNTFIFTRTPYDPTAPIPGGVDANGWRGPSR